MRDIPPRFRRLIGWFSLILTFIVFFTVTVMLRLNCQACTETQLFRQNWFIYFCLLVSLCASMMLVTEKDE